MESFGLRFELGFTQVVFNCVAPLLVFAMQTAIKSMPFLFLQTIGLDELHFSYVSGPSTGDWLGCGVMVGATEEGMGASVGAGMGAVVGEEAGQ